MIFQTPSLTAADKAVIGLIQAQQQQLRLHVSNNPQRWTGFLRQTTLARAIRGSNSIEGYNATMDDAVAVVKDEDPFEASRETWRAISGYRDVLTYILQLSGDPNFVYHPVLLRSLHFMMLKHDLQKLPGQWRLGPVYIVRENTGEAVYEGPDASVLPALIDELIGSLNADAGVPPLVKAAMAHLNLTMIHPFKDGNGRMARALQTLVLSREGILSPTFCSIEEWLGSNTERYYAILEATGQGKWQPQRDALPWVRFCLTAHYQQAATLSRRNAELSEVYGDIAQLIRQHDLPERVENALIDGAYGYRIRNSGYRQAADVSEVVASRDLRRLCELGYLTAIGEKKGRFYRGSEQLQKLREKYRQTARIDDPYQLVGDADM